MARLSMDRRDIAPSLLCLLERKFVVRVERDQEYSNDDLDSLAV